MHNTDGDADLEVDTHQWRCSFTVLCMVCGMLLKSLVMSSVHCLLQDLGFAKLLHKANEDLGEGRGYRCACGITYHMQHSLARLVYTWPSLNHASVERGHRCKQSTPPPHAHTSSSRKKSTASSSVPSSMTAFFQPIQKHISLLACTHSLPSGGGVGVVGEVVTDTVLNKASRGSTTSYSAAPSCSVQCHLDTVRKTVSMLPCHTKVWTTACISTDYSSPLLSMSCILTGQLDGHLIKRMVAGPVILITILTAKGTHPSKVQVAANFKGT